MPKGNIQLVVGHIFGATAVVPNLLGTKQQYNIDKIRNEKGKTQKVVTFRPINHASRHLVLFVHTRVHFQLIILKLLEVHDDRY